MNSAATISRELIYEQAGRDDRVTMFWTKPGTLSSAQYGSYLIGLPIYTQWEREELEQNLHATPPRSTGGAVRIRMSLSALEPNPKHPLPTYDVPIEGIALVDGYGLPSQNRFAETQDRKSQDLVVHVTPLPKGRDYDLIYHLARAEFTKGHQLSPDELLHYYAMELYYDQVGARSQFSDQIYENGVLRTEIELRYIGIKYIRGEASKEELTRSSVLLQEKQLVHFRAMHKYLIAYGMPYNKMLAQNKNLLEEICLKVYDFKEKRLNTLGKVHVYLDFDRYIHILFRHVREFMFSKQVVGRDFFQWHESEVIRVIERVVQDLDKEIQKHFREKPGKAFWRSGRMSHYFEGDYYTVHVATDGRLLTLYRNRKRLPTSVSDRSGTPQGCNQPEENSGERDPEALRGDTPKNTTQP